MTIAEQAKPCRVAMIGQYGIPAAYGGVERAVEELGAELAERGLQVTVYCSSRRAKPLSLYRGMQLRSVPEIRGKFLGKLSQAGFSSLDAIFRRYDIVHFHAMGPCVYAPLIRLLRPDVVVCSTIHSRDDLFEKWKGPARWFFKIAAFCAIKVPHQVMVVSDNLREQVKVEFGTEATVVRNGVATVPAHGQAEELDRWGLTPERYVLAVGRLVHEKATDDLIAAFALVSTDWKLVIVGEHAHTSSFSDAVRELAARDNRVILTGSVYGAPLDALYRHAGAFALPSRLEGMPVVLLEAIGYGLPVIVSDIAPNLEVVQSCGPGHRVFRVGSIRALAEAIETVVSNNHDECEGAKKLRDRVLKEFSWAQAAAITEQVYSSCLRR